MEAAQPQGRRDVGAEHGRVDAAGAAGMTERPRHARAPERPTSARQLTLQARPVAPAPEKAPLMRMEYVLKGTAAQAKARKRAPCRTASGSVEKRPASGLPEEEEQARSAAQGEGRRQRGAPHEAPQGLKAVRAEQMPAQDGYAHAERGHGKGQEGFHARAEGHSGENRDHVARQPGGGAKAERGCPCARPSGRGRRARRCATARAGRGGPTTPRREGGAVEDALAHDGVEVAGKAEQGRAEGAPRHSRIAEVREPPRARARIPRCPQGCRRPPPPRR